MQPPETPWSREINREGVGQRPQAVGKGGESKLGAMGAG